MATASESLRVLVVDDELLVRWSVTETLKRHGYLVVEAECGAAAVRALQDCARPVDVVVLDYRLPDAHDLSLLTWIRGHAPDVPVVLITAYGTPDLVADACGLGAYDVMDKPFEMDELEAVVFEACEAR